MTNKKHLTRIGWISGAVAVLVAAVMLSSKTNFFYAGAGRIMYVFDLCAGQDDLWVVYPTKWDLSEFSIYSHGKEERGTETRPRIEGRPKWNPYTERFYYLSGKRLMEYNPVTGAVEKYKLEQKYQLISAMDGNALILQPEYGADIYYFSIETKQETKLNIAGSVSTGKLYDGCLLLKRRLPHDHISRELTCYDYQKNQELWTKSLDSLFPAGVSTEITLAEGRVWLWAGNQSILYSTDLRSGDFEPIESQRLAYIVDTAHGLVCAGKTDKVNLYILSSDGTQTHIGNFNTELLLQTYDPIRMTTFQGKLYYAFVEAEDAQIYSCDLPPQTKDILNPASKDIS